MEAFEDLRVLAQLAMTLIGFTGIVGVLQSRGGAVITDIDRTLIVGLLLMSTATLFLSFVPSWIESIPDVAENVWLYSFRVLLAGHLAAWGVAIPFLMRGSRLFVAFPKVDRVALFFMTGFGVVAVIVEAVIASGELLRIAPFVYEGVMIFFLAIGTYSFFRLLLKPE